MEPFGALADPTRRRILEMLAERDLPAGELAAHFAITASAISQHLKVLREAGLVQVERQAQQRIYGLDREAFAALVQWLAGIGGVALSGSQSHGAQEPDSGRQENWEAILHRFGV
jgi:DNA-binding transcriptional ArsR family regulator